MTTTRSGMREAKRLRSRRMRAVLASGLVLGVGAAGTLAVWNDSEHTTTTFTAGQFGIVGAVNGGSFSEHASAGAAASLVFAAPLVSTSAMAPGNTVYALFSVKTISPSVKGSVQLTADSGNGAGLGQYLVYSVRTIGGTTCDGTTFGAGTEVVPATQPLTTGATGSQALQANGANQFNYCFAVTLDVNAPTGAQNATVTPKWVFSAVSTP